jgi:hypothetical protein
MARDEVHSKLSGEDLLPHIDSMVKAVCATVSNAKVHAAIQELLKGGKLFSSLHTPSRRQLRNHLLGGHSHGVL